MALGQSIFSRNGNNNGKKTINVYSQFRMTNSKDVNKYGASAISFSYWQGCLKIAIAPLKMVNGQDFPVSDRDREVYVFIKQSKAYILAREIDRLIAGEGESVGVVSGTDKFISISNGHDFGVDQPVICIRKFNKDSNAIEEEALFICRTDFHYSIHNFNTDTMDGEKDFESYKYMDLIDLKTVLDEYYTSMSNAYAYSVHETAQYVNGGTKSVLESIADKLGVSTGSAGTSYNNSLEGNSGGTSFKRATLDDI